VTIIIFLLALSFFAFCAFLLSQSVFYGWIILLAVNLYNFTFGLTQYNIGGIHLDPLDVVMIALLCAGITRTLPRLKERNTPRLLALGFTLLMILSIARGMLDHGVISAANESRAYAGSLAAVLYFLTAKLDTTSIRRFLAAYLCYGGALTVVALLAYAGLDVGAIAWAHHAQGAELGIDGRYLPSDAALAIAICFILALGTTGCWPRLRGAGKWLSPIFLGMAVFLRHRTIWVALAFGIATLAMLDKRSFRRLIPMLVLSVFVIVAITAISGESRHDTTEQFAESAENEGTFMWRVNSWKALLLDKDQTLSTVMFGKSVGSGYWRYDIGSGGYIDVAPHSEYVTYYLRVGILGLMFFLWYLLRTVRVMWMAARDNSNVFVPPAAIWAAMLVVILIYNITYFAPQDAYAIFALTNAFIASTAMASGEHISLDRNLTISMEEI
jgi:hypothetical protein